MRNNRVVELSISNFCNFSCDYCISGSIKKKIPTNSDGSVRRFKDLRYNDRGVVDLRRVRKYGLTIRGGVGDTSNFGIENPDGTIDRSGDHVIENDFIDYDALLRFIRSKLSGWVVQVTGGEPLYNPGFDGFLIELVKTHRVILLTNLSLLPANKWLLDIPADRLFYKIGYHPEQFKIEQYLKNIFTLRDHGKPFIVNYVLHPRHMRNGMAKAYVDVLVDNELSHEVTRFYGTWEDKSYPTKELIDIEKLLLSEHSISNDFTTDENTPGTTFLAIYPDGNIYQCSKQTVSLGSIYEDFMPYHRVKMPQCFSSGNSCQSVISQEVILNDW